MGLRCRGSRSVHARFPVEGRGRRAGVLVLLSVLAWTSAAEAQFIARLANPLIDVTIEHPPELNILADTIVFGQAVGKCADEITQALVDDFLRSGLEVVDRGHLDAILAEHDLAARGLSDPSTMLAIGEIVGPSALISVSATRCEPKQETFESRGTESIPLLTVEDDEGDEESVWVDVPVTTRTARTSIDMRISLRVIELATGRVFGGRSFAASPSAENSLRLDYPDDESSPEYPPESFVVDLAVGSILEEVRAMFFPRFEARQVVFYNNGRCGLRSAYLALEIGDHDRALELSRRNLEYCREDRTAKRKVLANAYYNLGMVQMIVGDYQEALGNLSQAERLRPGSVVNEAIAETRAAWAASAARERFNEETDLLAEAREDALVERIEAEAASTLTNDDVLSMVEAGLPDSIIVARIRSATTGFSLGTADLVALTEAGVSEEIIVAMISSDNN